MNTFQTLMALVVLIYVLSVIVQVLQQGVKWVFGMKAMAMENVIRDFMGQNILTPNQVKDALEKLGFKAKLSLWAKLGSKAQDGSQSGGSGDLSALENFNDEDFRKLMDAIQFTESNRPEIERILGVTGLPIAESVERFKQHAEAAYDAAMVKFQNVYARNNKWAVIVISFVVVLGLNASVIKLYDILSVNQAMSQTIAATGATVGQASPGTGGTQALDPEKTRQAITKELQDYPILVRTLKYPEDIKDPGNDLGLIIMGFLVSLGAPFWNDVLKGTSGLNNVFNTRAKQNQ